MAEEQDQMAEFHSRLDRIEVTLDHAVNAIEKMSAVVNRPQRTQWGPIMTALALLFAAGGGYTTLITMPMVRETNYLRDQVILLEERELVRERDLGRIEGKLGIRLE